MNSDYRHIPNCYTKSSRTYTTPKVVKEENFDGWSNCDNCGKEMADTRTVHTHWLTVRKTYFSKEEVTDFEYFKSSDFTNDYDDFVFVTCGNKCSHQKLVKWANRNGEK